MTSLYTSIRRAALSTEAPWDSRLEIMAAPMTCQRIGFFVLSSAFRLQVRTSSGRSIDQEMSLMDLAKSMPKGMLGLVSFDPSGCSFSHPRSIGSGPLRGKSQRPKARATKQTKTKKDERETRSSKPKSSDPVLSKPSLTLARIRPCRTSLRCTRIWPKLAAGLGLKKLCRTGPPGVLGLGF